jgi:hypothetical protein
MKIPHIGHNETTAHLQKLNDHTKIAANHETKVKEDAAVPTPKVNKSKIDFKA